MAYYPVTEEAIRHYGITHYRGFSATHNGLDLTPSRNKDFNIPIIASDDGTVLIGADGYGGKWILITGTKKYFNLHLNRYTVQTGQRVKAGDIVGYMGNSGHIIPAPPPIYNGLHTHFEVRLLNNVRVDPEKQGLIYYGGTNEMVQYHHATSFITKVELGLYPQPDNVNPLTKIPKGTRFDIPSPTIDKGKDYEGNSCWYRVKYGGQVGWIPEAYISYFDDLKPVKSATLVDLTTIKLGY